MRRRYFIALALLVVVRYPAYSADQQWTRLSSEHFSVLTDAGDKRGREVLLRFEQMRAMFAELLMKTRVNQSEPLEIIAFKSDKEYAQLAPPGKGLPTAAPGFFLAGEDRNYIVLNLFEDESWRAVSYPFAHMLLNYNYPPTQSWFDEGFIEYFSSLSLDNKRALLGADPSIAAATPGPNIVTPRRLENAPKSFTELLTIPVWLAVPDLFSAQHDTSASPDSSHHSLYQAEAWIVMHYLINSNKLSETGTYFQQVEVEHLPVDQAIQKAYGMSAVQFEQAVRDYFKSLQPQFEGQAPPKNAAAFAVHSYPSPIPADTMGASAKQVPEPEARALIAEMAARMPQHREQAIGQLQAVIAGPKTDNAVAHRALGWIDIQKNDFEAATQELAKAIELDPHDPYARYELVLLKYKQAQSGGNQLHGLSNMMQDLRAVLDWDPDFADAYHLLALARREGGGNNSALEAERAAMSLNPRNQSYVLGLANIYIALKHWDAATTTLERLKTSSDPQIARAARKSLADLPAIKKYGILPEEVGASPEVSSQREEPLQRQSPQERQPPEDAGGNARSTASSQAPAPQQPDMRPVQFLKGKVVSVDCSQPPVALITVAAGTRRVRLRTADYKSLPLIGADQFSCDWKNVAVAVNYKVGKTVGDLVSLEVQ